MAKAKGPKNLNRDLPKGYQPIPSSQFQPIQDLTNLLSVDGKLVVAETGTQAVLTHARFMLPEQAAQYGAWAIAHPTMDPRTWVPLATAGIDPYSKEAQSVSVADLARQASDPFSAGGAAPGQTVTPMGSDPFGSGVSTTPISGVTATGGAGPAAPTQSATPDTGGGLMGLVDNVIGSVQSGWESLVGGAQTAARTVQYGFQSEWDAMMAVPRTAAGLNEKQVEVAKKYGLSQEEANVAFPISPQVQAIAGKDLNTLPSNEAEQPQGWWQGMIAGMTHKGQSQVGGSSVSVDNIPEDRKALIKQAQDEWAKQAPSATAAAKQVVSQTAAGQIIKNPALLQHDTGWLAGNPLIVTGTGPSAGKVWVDPATGKPMTNPDGTPITPDQSNVGTDVTSLQAYDMRTKKEIADGIKPIGWTPGRGVANNFWSPDTQAFQTVSGVIDFSNNLFLDPANLIPVNWIAKGAKGAGKVLKGADSLTGAMEASASKVAVQTTRAAAKKAAVVNSKAVGKEAMEGLDVTRVAEPVLVDRAGSRFDAETGLVTSKYPHSNFVMTDRAWQFFNSGRGTKVIADLTAEKSAANIWLRSNRKIDPDLAVALANASSPEEVRAVLGPRMGIDLNDPKALRNFGPSGPQLLFGRGADSAQGAAPGIFRNMAMQDSPFIQYLRKAPNAFPMDLEDTGDAVTQLERWGRGARMDWAQVGPHLDKIMAARSPGQRYQAIFGKGGFMDGVADHLVATEGLAKKDAAYLTRAFEGGLDETVRNYLSSGIILDGGKVANDPMLMAEILNRAVILPDYRTIRAVTGQIAQVRKIPGLGKVADQRVLDVIHGVTTAWKSSVLARPAYAIREAGELATAMSLSGYEGLFTHPGAFISAAMMTAIQKESEHTVGNVAKWLSGGDVVKAAAHTGALDSLLPSATPGWGRVNGGALFDAYNSLAREPGNISSTDKRLQAIYGGLSGVHGNFGLDVSVARGAARHVGVAAKDNIAARDAFVQGLAEKIRRAHLDADARNIADPNLSIEDVIAEMTASSRGAVKKDAFPDSFAKGPQQYVADLEAVLNKIHGGDDVLREAIVTGMYEGKSILKKPGKTKDGRINIFEPDFLKYIEDLLDDSGRAASINDTMTYLKYGSKYDKAGMVRAVFERVTDAVFQNTGELADILARGPLLRQAYAEEVIRLVPEMTPAAKAKAVENLRKVGDTKLAREVMASGKANGTLSTDVVDLLAGQHAVRESKRIFYDAHEVQNYALALRAISPFIQATMNTFRRWGQLSVSNPQLMYRTLKPLNYLQQPGSQVIYGDLGALYGDGKDALYDPQSYGYTSPDTRHAGANGFFFTDAYGDRKFAYPILGLLGGMSIPGVGPTSPGLTTSPLSGLNVAGTSLNPGVGPMITFPASFMAQDAINRDDAVGSVLRWTFQFGLPQGTAAERLWQSFAPTWGRKLAAGGDEETMANRAIKIMPALYSTGDYDLTSPADVKRMSDDAMAMASRQSAFLAITSAITPASTGYTALVQINPDGQVATSRSAVVDAIMAADPKDKSGALRRLMLQDQLRTEWNKYTGGKSGQEYKDGELAFVHDYGTTALLSVMPSTEGENGMTPAQATNDVWAFRYSQPDAYRQHQDVIGLFFAGGSAFIPGDNSPTGFSRAMYESQKASGERNIKVPSTYVSDSMKELGWLLWNPKAQEIELSNMSDAQKTNAKAGLRLDIKRRTAGYWTGLPDDPSKNAILIDHLARATQNEDIQTLRSASAIKEYMDYRDSAIQALLRNGHSTDLSSGANSDVSSALINKARDLMKQDTTGGFNNAWQRLLVHEFGA